MPAISIIVPLYKVEKYLPACIESILSQTFTDFELILVDDGSPDSCGAICDQYAERDSRILVIHKENGGVSDARNHALDRAAGKYVAFCDSDDYLAYDHLEKLVEAMEQTDCDIVNGNFLKVDEDGTVTEKSNAPQETVRLVTQQEQFDFLVGKILSGSWGWSVWTRLFRNDIIQQNHIRFCTTCANYAEDLGFVFQYCLYIRSAASIADPIYHYRAREGSMMANSVGVLKLNATNNLSIFLFDHFRNRFSEPNVLKQFPVIHFLVMCPEYRKIACTPFYSALGEHNRKITHSHWNKRNLSKLFLCMPVLKSHFGTTNARRILLLANYARHGCWKRFIIESAITYKWFVKI